ncbi:MarR family transcriptional regulator [Actinomadura sp. DC4]|uniref:MarR family winged helix-turn-helix transcriptional regulator n=1 Tax=Actinomadura sp. DC4 TaxID=3055069 RepID=UPI0025B186EA|nr:MarR family transcriptional regulator [Actinomadura sp. DC4]MDN3358559.1 MarR family transcriptional regulator [Actinomadura sp. DC4]
MSSTSGVAAWAALLRLHAEIVPILDRELQATCDMPLTWYDLLLKLYRAPEHRLSMNQLGDASVLSRSRVSRLVDELTAAGMVTREPNPDDRRSAFATLTDKGRERFRAAAPVHLDSIERHFSTHLSEHDADVLASALGRVLEAETGTSLTQA